MIPFVSQIEIIFDNFYVKIRIEYNIITVIFTSYKGELRVVTFFNFIIFKIFLVLINII
jgi:hypothetical protein